MAKRKRGARNSAVRSKIANRDVVERVETPWFAMERHGKRTAMQRTAEPGVDILAELFGSKEELAQRLEDRHEELVGLVADVDPAELLARASLTYMAIDPYSFDERAETRSPAHVEYLMVQSLLYSDWTSPPNRDPGAFDEQNRVMSEALEAVQDLFRLRSWSVILDAKESAPSDPLEAERILRLRLHSMAVRGSGYEPHMHQVLGRIFEKCDEQVRAELGFAPSIYREVVESSGKLVQQRLDDRRDAGFAHRKEMQRQLKRSRRRNEAFAGRDLNGTTPSEQKQLIDYMVASWVLLDSRELAEFEVADLAELSGHDASEITAFLDAFTLKASDCDPNHHRLPFGTLPASRQPVVRSSTGYMIPSQSTVLEAIRPRIEELLKGTPAWDVYERARAAALEELTVEALHASLPGSKSWLNIDWTAGDQQGELDGLVHLDDLGIRVQCKAGALTPESRRGAPRRLDADIKKLISEASEQHESLESAVATGALSGLSAAQEEAVAAPLQVEAVVTLEDVSQLATTPDRLAASKYIGENGRRWIVPLFDLLVICEMLRSERLAHYIVRRLRLHDDGRVVDAHDELDYLGHYFQDRLYLDPEFEDSDIGMFRLESHTSDFDSYYLTRNLANPAPKPEIEEPPGLRVLLRRLRRERPRHWITAALVAINGDREATDQISDFVVSINERLGEKGWTNATVVFGDLGFTIFVHHTASPSEAVENMRDYASSKMKELEMPNWLLIGEGGTGGLFVLPLPGPESVIESIFGRSQDPA